MLKREKINDSPQSKDPDAHKDGGQEEKWATEDKKVGSTQWT